MSENFSLYGFATVSTIYIITFLVSRNRAKKEISKSTDEDEWIISKQNLILSNLGLIIVLIFVIIFSFLFFLHLESRIIQRTFAMFLFTLALLNTAEFIFVERPKYERNIQHLEWEDEKTRLKGSINIILFRLMTQVIGASVLVIVSFW